MCFLRNAVGLIGGESVFIDCEDGSPNLNFEQVKKNNPDILIAPSSMEFQ